MPRAKRRCALEVLGPAFDRGPQMKHLFRAFDRPLHVVAVSQVAQKNFHARIVHQLLASGIVANEDANTVSFLQQAL